MQTRAQNSPRDLDLDYFARLGEIPAAQSDDDITDILDQLSPDIESFIHNDEE